MNIICVGLNFKTASIEIQESLAKAVPDVSLALQEIMHYEGVLGVYILSTCNRFEVYVDAKSDSLAHDAIQAFFTDAIGKDLTCLRELRERGAINHLVRVACSLESRIIGEAQILGQVKKAMEIAQENETLTEDLRQLVTTAISTGKRVRAKTALGDESISLSTVALKMASQVSGGLENKTYLVVGVGEMARLAAVYLKDISGVHVYATSKNAQHAARFAEEFGFECVAFDDLYSVAASVDIVFVAVRADYYILMADKLNEARKAVFGDKAFQKKLVLIDEGMPRNVDPACHNGLDVEVIDLDRLNKEIDMALQRREAAMKDAWEYVDNAVDAYCYWVQERYVSPTIKDMYLKGESLVEQESAHAERELTKLLQRELTKEEGQMLSAYGRAIMKKLLHGPAARLKKEAHTPNASSCTVTTRYLFGLDTGR